MYILSSPSHTTLQSLWWDEFTRALTTLATQDEIYIGLSGGSSLDIFYMHLRDHLQTLDLDIRGRLRFCLLDERIVSENHPDSNLGQLRKKFLTALVEEMIISEDQIISVFPSSRSMIRSSASENTEHGLLRSSQGQEQEESSLAKSYSHLVPRVDIALVGVGPDGHIASLFPHHPLLDSTHVGYLEITDSPKLPSHRITVSPAMLRSAPYVLVAFMRGKEVAYKQFQDNTLSVADCPVRLLIACDHLVVMSDIDE